MAPWCPIAGRSRPPSWSQGCEELKAHGNEIRLCSNSRRGNYAKRLDAIAAQLKVVVCPVTFRKPSTLAISGLDRNGRPLVVIGDSGSRTDGLPGAARRRSTFHHGARRKLRSRRPASGSSRAANVIDTVFGADRAISVRTRSARPVERFVAWVSEPSLVSSRRCAMNVWGAGRGGLDGREEIGNQRFKVGKSVSFSP